MPDGPRPSPPPSPFPHPEDLPASTDTATPAPAAEGPGQYFDARPQARSARRPVPLTLPDRSVELLADRAVFSAERVDAGTKYLLIEVPEPPPATRHALDLGCGYGPIAVTLAHRAPQATVWAVDVNERAVGLCRDNADRLGHPNVRTVVVSDDQPAGDIPDDVRFDVIWSNPPIRVGKGSLHDMLRFWLARLTPDGHAYLVVQKHLGSDSLQRWLTDQGWAAERLGARAGYRILDVSPPTEAPPPDDPPTESLPAGAP